MEKPIVVIRKCEAYNREKLTKIFLEGIEILNLKDRIKENITIKPNVVLAHPKVAPSAYTRPEFLDALLCALEKINSHPHSFFIVENSGTGVPTSKMFKRAGYNNLKKIHRIQLKPYEESSKIKVKLQKGKVHSEINVQKEIVERDFLIYAPKLKSNVLSHGLTASIKLNIGILGDKERMLFHDFRLHEKMVDLLEVGYPDFIATDAIEIAMGGNQMTEHSLDLGVVIMSSHPLSHDVVCAHILNINPENILALTEASLRGYGSLKIEDIKIDTDIKLEELKERTATRGTGFLKVDVLDSPVKVVSGESYCYGGCNGIMLDWLYMLKDRAPQSFKRKRDITVIIGRFKGEVESKKVILLGDCTEVEGILKAKKIFKIKGCPVKHKDIILHFFLKTFIRAPLLRPELLMDAYPLLWWSHFKGWIKERLKI